MSVKYEGKKRRENARELHREDVERNGARATDVVGKGDVERRQAGTIVWERSIQERKEKKTTNKHEDGAFGHRTTIDAAGDDGLEVERRIEVLQVLARFVERRTLALVLKTKNDS